MTKREDHAKDEGHAAESADEADHENGSSTDAALAALLEAGPEAFDHLLKAAQELLLAAKAVVDAGERAVESHRTATDAAAHTSGAPDPEPRVRRIDLA